MEYNNALERFILYQECSGNTDDTIRSYRERINKFINFVHSNLDNKKFIDINENDIIRYTMYLKSRNYKNVSMRSYLVALKTFLKFSHKQNFITENYYDDIVLPKAEKNVVKILTREEIKYLISCFNKKSMLGLRNLCITMLMLDCGLRKAEVENLCIDDVNYQKGYLNINGKGRKQRIVPVGLMTKRYLMDYHYKYRKPNDVYEEKFFLDKYGNPMSKECIKNFYYRLKAKTGIKRLHPHLLRHTFATNFLVNELGSIYELSLLLGHEDVKTTEVYLSVASYHIYMNKHKKSKSYLDKII